MAPGEKAARRHRAYPVKAALLLVLLIVCARFASSLPAAPLAVLLAALAVVSTVTPMYVHVVLRKTPRHQQFEPGSALSAINNGRMISIVVFFVISAVCSMSLLFGLVSWGLRDWGMALLSAIVFPLVYLFTAKVTKREVTLFFQDAYSVRASCVIVTIVLLAVDAWALLNGSAPEYQGPVQAVLSVDQPFEGSSSVLLSDAAWLSALVKGMSAYVLSDVAVVSYPVYCAVELLLDAAACWSVACLFGACWLDRGEIAVVFSPIRADANSEERARPMKRYVVLAAVLPVLLVAGCVWADGHSAEIEQSGEVTGAKELVRNAAGFSVDVIDGVSYDHALLVEKYALLSAQAGQELSPLVDEAFQKRIENVDGFLGWYYGTDLVSTLQKAAQKVGSAFIDKFKKDDAFKRDVTEHLGKDINADVDDGELVSKAQGCIERANALIANDKGALADCAVGREIPDWLRKEAEDEPDSATDLEDAKKPVQNLVDACGMLGITSGPDANGRDVVSRSLAEYLAGSDIGSSLIDDPLAGVPPWGKDDCKRRLVKALTDRRAEILTKLTAGDVGEG